MELTQILERATENTGLNQAQAETALPAFLETLSLRLTEDEQQDLAAQLPEELQGTLHATDPDVEKLSPDQFVERFAQRRDRPGRGAGGGTRVVGGGRGSGFARRGGGGVLAAPDRAGAALQKGLTPRQTAVRATHRRVYG